MLSHSSDSLNLINRRQNNHPSSALVPSGYPKPAPRTPVDASQGGGSNSGGSGSKGFLTSHANNLWGSSGTVVPTDTNRIKGIGGGIGLVQHSNDSSTECGCYVCARRRLNGTCKLRERMGLSSPYLESINFIVQQDTRISMNNKCVCHGLYSIFIAIGQRKKHYPEKNESEKDKILPRFLKTVFHKFVSLHEVMIIFPTLFPRQCVTSKRRFNNFAYHISDRKRISKDEIQRDKN